MTRRNSIPIDPEGPVAKATTDAAERLLNAGRVMASKFTPLASDSVLQCDAMSVALQAVVREAVLEGADDEIIATALGALLGWWAEYQQNAHPDAVISDLASAAQTNHRRFRAARHRGFDTRGSA